MKSHNQYKRRNITQWMESRLQRLRVKIDRGINVCQQHHDRAHQLANQIQIAWGNQQPAMIPVRSDNFRY